MGRAVLVIAEIESINPVGFFVLNVAHELRGRTPGLRLALAFHAGLVGVVAFEHVVGPGRRLAIPVPSTRAQG